MIWEKCYEAKNSLSTLDEGVIISERADETFFTRILINYSLESRKSDPNRIRESKMLLPIYFIGSPHKYPIPQRSKYIWFATKKTHTMSWAMLKFKFSIHLRRSYTQLNHMHLLIRNYSLALLGIFRNILSLWND